MPDTTDQTATVTTLPTAMPRGPQRPAGSQRAAGNDGRQQLTAAQTMRHLATQHALTFNHDEDLTLEELLADAATIERYIRDGTRTEPEPEPTPELDVE